MNNHCHLMNYTYVMTSRGGRSGAHAGRAAMLNRCTVCDLAVSLPRGAHNALGISLACNGSVAHQPGVATPTSIVRCVVHL